MDGENTVNTLIEKRNSLSSHISDSSWEKRLFIEDEIELLEKQIQNKIESKEHNEYYLSVIPILKKYSDFGNKVNQQEKHVDIMDMFSNAYKNTKNSSNKGQLYKEYISVIDNHIVDNEDVKESYICKICSVSYLVSQIESLLICPKCGKTEQFFDISVQGMTYEQEITSEVNVSFSYKRINHFNEWLAQFQAKESTDIPVDLLDLLTKEFKKERISDITQITTKKVKEYLKKLNFNKFYEHTTHITNMLNGIQPPTMDPVLEEKLRNMFRQIQTPFEKHKPKERSNFLSYSYCLYKFCELLGEDEFKKQFSLLKSREKLYQQDCIWRKICADIRWEFIATI
jgi:rubrerythrin